MAAMWSYIVLQNGLPITAQKPITLDERNTHLKSWPQMSGLINVVRFHGVTFNREQLEVPQ